MTSAASRNIATRSSQDVSFHFVEGVARGRDGLVDVRLISRCELPEDLVRVSPDS